MSVIIRTVCHLVLRSYAVRDYLRPCSLIMGVITSALYDFIFLFVVYASGTHSFGNYMSAITQLFITLYLAAAPFVFIIVELLFNYEEVIISGLLL